MTRSTSKLSMAVLSGRGHRHRRLGGPRRGSPCPQQRGPGDSRGCSVGWDGAVDGAVVGAAGGALRP